MPTCIAKNYAPRTPGKLSKKKQAERQAVVFQYVPRPPGRRPWNELTTAEQWAEVIDEANARGLAGNYEPEEEDDDEWFEPPPPPPPPAPPPPRCRQQ